MPQPSGIENQNLSHDKAKKMAQLLFGNASDSRLVGNTKIIQMLAECGNLQLIKGKSLSQTQLPITKTA